MIPAEIWAKLSTKQINGLILALGLLCAGIGFLLSQATSVSVDALGIKIEKQAIANQKDLEKALILLQVQQQANEQLVRKAKRTPVKTPAQKALRENVELAAELVPDGQIAELEQTVKESQNILSDRE